MTFAITQAHNTYRLAGTATFADLGPLPSKIMFYATTQPALGAAAGGTPLVTMVLTDPCGVITGNVLVLTQADPSGDLVFITGSALWARWVNGNGDLVGDGDVSDAAGAGFFKLSGTTGTILYAGARAILGTTAIG